MSDKPDPLFYTNVRHELAPVVFTRGMYALKPGFIIKDFADKVAGFISPSGSRYLFLPENIPFAPCDPTPAHDELYLLVHTPKPAPPTRRRPHP